MMEVKYYDGTSSFDLRQLNNDLLSGLNWGRSAEIVQEGPSLPQRTDGWNPNLIALCGSENCSLPLGLPNFQQAYTKVTSEGLYNVDAVIDSLCALVNGHLLLTGPPGTGKTHLARQLADIFNARLVVATATPEWSVYDLIGAPTLSASGAVVPRLGIVTSALLECCGQVDKNPDADLGEPQAVWLLIDELNRAEIDRAFGPLFTALSDPHSGSIPLEFVSGTPQLQIPRRFRIIATANTFDTRFVNTMSAALRRRFSRVAILPPQNEQGGIPDREFELALGQAASNLIGALEPLAIAAARAIINNQRELLRASLGALRDSGVHGGIPFGTAQVQDVCTFALTIAAMSPQRPGSKPIDIVDSALAVRLITSLESDASRVRIEHTFLQNFEQSFPGLRRTLDRLHAFVEARD